MPVIIDSNITLTEALNRVAVSCPQVILDAQRLVDVIYPSFDGRRHKGQIIVHEQCVQRVKTFFEIALREEFPIDRVIPISRYRWRDDISMADNNTSGFCYRLITDSQIKLSKHSWGTAFDVNPRQNPYIKMSEDYRLVILPSDSRYHATVPGTLVWNHPLVRFVYACGDEWGGMETWIRVKDFQHVQMNIDDEGLLRTK